MALGHWILGIEAPLIVPVHRARPSANAGADLWHNFMAIFSPETRALGQA